MRAILVLAWLLLGFGLGLPTASAQDPKIASGLLDLLRYVESQQRSGLSLSEIPLPFPAVALAPAEAVKVKSGHGVPVRVPPEAAGAPMVRFTADGDLLALGILEPLGRGALALARPKIVLSE